jgi:hypothetical protein
VPYLQVVYVVKLFMGHQGENGQGVFDADFLECEVDFLLGKHGDQLARKGGGKKEILPEWARGEQQDAQLFGKREPGECLQDPARLLLDPAEHLA